MSDEDLSVEEILAKLDADPVAIKHHKVNRKISEINEQIEFLQEQFPNE